MSLSKNSLSKFRKLKKKIQYDSLEEYEEKENSLYKKFFKKKGVGTSSDYVKIIAGKAKGIQLDVPSETKVVTSRIKTTLFDLLGPDIVGKRVLDLYAGAGSLGLESLSRGASEATFVDPSKHAEPVLINNCKKAGFITNTTVVRDNIEDHLVIAKDEEDSYDIIFITPPYKLFNRKDLTRMTIMLNDVTKLLVGIKDEKLEGFLGAFIIVHPRKYPIEKIEIDGIIILDTYNFGVNSLTFYVVERGIKKEN